MDNRNKKKYIGEFNVYGQCFTLYTWASCSGKAYRNFVYQLNKKTELPVFQLYSIFNNTRDNLRITEERNVQIR